MPRVSKNEVSGMQSKSNCKARYWILTIPYEHFTPYLPTQCSYLLGQMEIGESGFKHWQLLVAFKESLRLAALKKIFGVGIHAEPSRSDAAEAYCQKVETRVEGTQFCLGKKPVRRGCSTDWDDIWDKAKRGDMDSIPADIKIRYYSTLKRIGVDHVELVGTDKKITVYWGPTGTGKSHTAWVEAGFEAYPKDPMTKTWDGYQGQVNVVIEEYRGAISISHFLRWLDKYPVLADVKYSATPLLAQNIWITSNLHPGDWYPDLDQETKNALMRRLTIVYKDRVYIPPITEEPTFPLFPM